MKPNKSSFLNSINNYRAIAIIYVVVSHCYLIANIHFNSFFEITIRNLLSGGTINFLFISGFLFHHIFYKKYFFKTFTIKKFQILLIPYLLLSLLPIIIKLIIAPGFWNNYAYLQNDNIIIKYGLQSLAYLVSGEHIVAYWYIPMILIMFLLSPLHILFIKLKFNQQVLILLFFSIVSLIIHRPSETIYVYHSLLYFIPIYLLGIICSINRKIIYLIFKGKEFYFLLFGIAVALLQAYIGVAGNYEKELFQLNGIDLMFIQKIAFCFFFLIWLHRFEDFNNKYINILASTSFSVYFLHGYILRILRSIVQFFDVTFYTPWLSLFLFALLIILLCVSFALVVKRITPKYSKYIIGY